MRNELFRDYYMCISYICIYIRSTYLLSIIENRFCCCIRYNIQLSLRHALFNRSFLLFAFFSFPNSLSLSLPFSLSHSFSYTDTQSHTYNTRSFFSFTCFPYLELSPHIHSYKYSLILSTIIVPINQ